MKADRDLINQRVAWPNEANHPKSMVTPRISLPNTDKSILKPRLEEQKRLVSIENLVDIESEAVLQLDRLMKIRTGKKKVPEELNQLIEEQREVVKSIQRQIAINK